MKRSQATDSAYLQLAPATRSLRGILATMLGVLALTLGAAPAGADEHGGYTVNPGDVLLISVWKEEDLSQEVLVRPDGGLSFPLVGEIDGRGKTVSEITEQVREKLEKYIPDPVVTVAVRQLLGNQIYIIGKVNQPGAFTVNSNVDVMQALSMAGGMNPFASANNIKVLRREGGEQRAIPFRYGDIEDGRNLGQNIVLQSGDIVVVP